MNTAANAKAELLRVAHPRECNTQHTSLKALALHALSRGGRTTQAENPRNKLPSQEGDLLRELRAKLKQLATAESIDPSLIHALPDADVAACAELDDNALTAYVRALRDTDLREHYRVPPDETAPALCRTCGPIWAAPEVAATLPVIDGWPRALGCPWCHVRNRQVMPRPTVCCGDCQHFKRNTMNPGLGAGHCVLGCDPSRPWPNAKLGCSHFLPQNFPLARD